MAETKDLLNGFNVSSTFVQHLLKRIVKPFHSHVIGVCLLSQSASEKYNREKKSPQTFAHLVNFSKNVFATLPNLILYRVYMGVIVPEWHEGSCEPSFLQAILERCCPSTRMRYPSQSTQPLISYRWTKPRSSFTWYRYRMWSDFIRIQSYKWAPGWTRTGMKRAPVSCKHLVQLVKCKFDVLLK